MISPPGATVAVRGAQQPRISCVPDAVDSAGDEAIELAAMAGLILDPWQELVLRGALGERADGKWSAFQVGLVVGRQNGKNAVLEARELYELILLPRSTGPRVVVHSAHLFKTAKNHYRRLRERIKQSPELLSLVRHRGSRINGFVEGKGDEAIWFEDGSVVYFVSRTGSGGQGRGLTGDLVVWDEAMNLPDAVVGDVMPILSARTLGAPGVQLWYTGSAVNQQTMPYGLQLTRVRNAGIGGENPVLAYYEWSVDDAEFALHPELISDPEAWALANPGLGERISVEHVFNELRAMPRTEFLVERLGIGDWPDVSEDAGRVITDEQWRACIDATSRRGEGAAPVFALDATPQRDWATIAVAAPRADGRTHVEVVAHDRGVPWAVARIAELRERHPTARFVVDPRGPAASEIPDLREAGVDVVEVSTADYARACGAFFDAATARPPALAHDGRQPMLDAALAVAAVRPLADAWAWKRREAGVPICPLVAVTLAYWQATRGEGPPPAVRMINLDDLDD